MYVQNAMAIHQSVIYKLHISLSCSQIKCPTMVQWTQFLNRPFIVKNMQAYYVQQKADGIKQTKISADTQTHTLK